MNGHQTVALPSRISIDVTFENIFLSTITTIEAANVGN